MCIRDSLQPGNKSFVAGGIWMPEAADLKAIRQEIDYGFADFTAVIQKPSFKKMFGELDQSEKLKKCPKDYSEDNPALEFLKLKSFTVGTPLSDKMCIRDRPLFGQVIRCAAHSLVFYSFANKPLIRPIAWVIFAACQINYAGQILRHNHCLLYTSRCV